MSLKTDPSHKTRRSLGLLGRFGLLMRYRELLLNLVRREIRGRYRASALGFLWSMLTPILYLAVFYVVFNIFLRGGIPYFPVFLLSGLLPWTLFASALSAGTSSVVGNAPLLKKVFFPREVLPLASIGAALFHFVLQMGVLIGFLVIFRYEFVDKYLLLVPVALFVELLLLAGLTLMLSAITVYLRDVQHFLELALLAWFWLTPIIYPVVLVFEKLSVRGMFGLYLLNPMTPIVLTFQRAFYGRVPPLLDVSFSWYLEKLAYVGLAGIALVFLGQMVFVRLEGNFAEEI